MVRERDETRHHAEDGEWVDLHVRVLDDFPLDFALLPRLSRGLSLLLSAVLVLLFLIVVLVVVVKVALLPLLPQPRSARVVRLHRALEIGLVHRDHAVVLLVHVDKLDHALRHEALERARMRSIAPALPRLLVEPLRRVPRWPTADAVCVGAVKVVVGPASTPSPPKRARAHGPTLCRSCCCCCRGRG